MILLPYASKAWAGDFSRIRNFDKGWQFSLGSPDAEARTVDLPHDWAIEGDFSKDNPSGTGGGALPGGIGWYRKTFTLPASDAGKKVYIDFDGAYMNSTVSINGHELGTRPYGYASFSYDLTPWLRKGENQIEVKVDNSEQPNSRWYSGCGIYRHVRLRVVDPVHIAQWGVFVRQDSVSHAKAALTIETTVENTGDRSTDARILTEVLAPDGTKVAEAETSAALAPGRVTKVSLPVDIAAPELWSINRPRLYTVVTKIFDKKKLLDDETTRTGFRYMEFDAQKGFSLNGIPTKIRGVCMHHDLGALGAAINTTALRRQLQIMKDMGANAIRCSHNPPAPELLDLCDEMGLMVMDEAFDMWRKKKTSHDYSRYFDEWHERDLTDLVTRDRNHPSVIIWSIGNEVLEQWSDAKADTLSLEEANLILNFGQSAEMLAKDGSEMSVNSLLTKKLADMTRALDPTRPVTAGCQEPDPGNHLFRSGALDIIGYNYHDEWFKKVPENFPGMPFIVTESVSALQTRGYYRMPSDSMYIWPKRWDIAFHDPSLSCSSYDNCHAPWGSTHEKSMREVEENDFIMGQFVWTGFDYIGEPTPYGWPARSSYFGIVDLAGNPKDSYYMYLSQWRPDLDVLHVFPHWNHTEGEDVDVWAYFNNADEVELYLNGRSLGTRTPQDSTYHVAWRVPFEPGTLEAVSRLNGQEVKRTQVKTAGEPAAIRLIPDRTEIAADGSDLCFVKVEITDKEGNLCPNADNDVTFAVEGTGFNAGVDNGSPISMERFKADHRRAFYGKALLIVQSDGTPGTVTVSATSPGLQPAKCQIETR